MSSRGKKKTTMAKLNREARLRERRSDKQNRKETRQDVDLVLPDRPNRDLPIEDPDGAKNPA